MLLPNRQFLSSC